MKKPYLIIIIACLIYGFSIKTASTQIQFRETVWLQTERDIYLSGEEIHFKAVLLENDSYKPSVLSKSLRVELCDEKGNKISQQNIELSDSKLSGKITIPTNLNTGRYYLRSYSNWMRNYGEDGFTLLPVRVLNQATNMSDIPTVTNNHLKLEIYPYTDPVSEKEMCSIFASDKHGTGIESQGFILSGPRDTVLSFNTGKTGWTNSFYSPSNENRYQAFAENIPQENIEYSITGKTAAGKKEILITRKYGHLYVEIKDPEPSTEYKILVHRIYSWSWYHSGHARNNELVFHVPLKDIPSGISQISILDNNNNQIYSRLWSDYGEYEGDIHIEPAGNKDIIIGTSHTFNFNIQSGPGGSENNHVNLLVHSYIPGSSVFRYIPGLPGWPATATIPAEKDAFKAWLNANSYPEGTATAFFRDSNERPQSPVFENADKTSIQYYPDTRAGTVRGRVTDSRGNALSRKSVALTILNDNRFYASWTDNNGNFALTFPGLHGPKDYILNFFHEYDPSWKLELESLYADFNNIPDKGPVSFTPGELEFLQNQGLLLQLKAVYYGSENDRVITTGKDSTRQDMIFYGKPDFSISIDDYISLPNMREVISEVVPFVSVRQKDDRYTLNVTADHLKNSMYPTLVLLDGIPLYQYRELLYLPPDRIKTIEGINDFYLHGNIVFSGVINIHSVNGDFAGLSLPEAAVLSSLPLPSMSQEIAFIDNITKEKEPGMPALNNILAWKRLENTESGTEDIRSGDNPGKYMITIYGYDDEGRWYRGKKLFGVYEAYEPD